MLKQSLVRSIGFVALTLQAWSLSAALSSSSYVQEGLVAQFDGVENVTRGGAHDASAAQWNDLVSGGTTYFTLSEGASFAGGNGFSVVQTWRGKANSNNAIYKAAMSTNFTFEVAYDQTSATEYEWTKGLSKRPKGTMLQFFHSYYWMGCDFNNNNGQMDCYIGFNPQGKQRGPGLNLLDYSGATGYSRGKHTLSCSQDAYDTFTNTACNISFDGVVKRTYTVDATVSANASRDNGGTWLNGNSSYENSGINGIYHEIRAYNRPLSADEVAVNAAVDKVRFFGADASAITLPSGWRFADVATDVKLERHFATVSASVSAGGTVQVGTSSAASSVDVWNEYPTLPVRTLSAVPSAGYRFMRWRGIESSDPYQATQTDVVVTGAVVAVFYATGPHTLNSKSYIQDGLQFQFDAVENVTRGGAHVADSAVWNDLVSEGAFKFDVSDTRAAFVDGNALSVVRAWGTVSTGTRAEQIRAMYNAATFTVEVAYDQTESNPDSGDGTYKGYFRKMLEFGHPGYWVGIDWSTESKKDYAIGFSPYNHRREHHINTGYYGSHQMTLGQHVVSCVQRDNDTTNVRFDHENSRDETFTGSTEHKDWSGIRFNSGNFTNSGMDGKYHEMRFYNRVLTDDERRVNYEVDAVRFFGKDPADSTLPDGYRFGTAEGVCLERQRTIVSSDASQGLVRVGSGAEAASVDAWIDVAAPQVTLTAVPVYGYKFVRWEGAIAGADLKASTGVFTVTGDVTAVFKESIGLTIIVK